MTRIMPGVVKRLRRVRFNHTLRTAWLSSPVFKRDINRQGSCVFISGGIIDRDIHKTGLSVALRYEKGRENNLKESEGKLMLAKHSGGDTRKTERGDSLLKMSTVWMCALNRIGVAESCI